MLLTFFKRLPIIAGFLTTTTGVYAQPANNDCSGAINLTTGTTCSNITGNITGATQSLAGCTGNANDDIWYSFTATASTATITVKGAASFNPVVQTFSTCGGASLGCVNNNGSGGTETQNLSGLTPGNTYWVRVYDFNNGTPANPTFQICVTVPPLPTPQDCGGGLSVCANAPFAGNPNGSGTVNDATGANFGCLVGGEHQSSWYYFSPISTGTLGLTITPSSTSTDYDWAIWGPVATISCPLTMAPVRCSSANGNNTAANITGLGNGAADLTEGSGGDGWVKALNVIAGEKYIMLLDNWTATSSPFTLTWQLGGGASLDCAPLPIGLTEFTGDKEKEEVLLKWVTATEVNNDYFTVEKSYDVISFEEIGTVKGAGNSSSFKYYNLVDPKPQVGINYYRLKQTDYNGKYTYSRVISVEFSKQNVLMNNIYPNPTTHHIYFDFYSPVGGTAHIQLIDYMGKLVSDEYKQLEEGKSVINVDMSDFSQGIYSLVVMFDKVGYSSVNKVIKQ